jgi:diaminopimelate decarboxylase
MAITNERALSLAKQYGTPLYVYDAGVVKRQIAALLSAFSALKPKLWYAMKANYNPHILKIMLDQGVGIDAVSPGDILLARKLGFKPEQILFTSNNITLAEMQEVQAHGVLFNIDSLSLLERYGKTFPGSNVCLRFNPDIVAGGHKHIMTGGDLTKFGILLDDAEAAFAVCKQHNLSVVGIHKHTGSGIKDPALFLEAVKNLLSIPQLMSLPTLEFLDFGGGFFVPYKPSDAPLPLGTFAEALSSLLDEFFQTLGRKLAVCFEPGKFLIAEAGNLFVEVTNLKSNKGRLIAGTNSGFSQLIRPMLYDAYHHISNCSNPNGAEQVYDIVGNICETGDRFAEQRPLPAISEGDILRIHNAGAYCYAMGGLYNLRAMPTEVVIDGDETTLSRERISSATLVDGIVNEANLVPSEI